MQYTNYKTRHYFNNILYTPWPFFIGICMFSIVYLSILMCNKYFFISTEVSLFFLFFFVYLLFESILHWFMEVIEESYYGKYTKKIRSALLFGFILFLLSEVMLFGSFFWVYFDRLFHLSYVTGFLSVPTSVETIRWFKEPLYATIVLFASGWTANYSYYMFKMNDITSLKKAYFLSVLTNFLGCVFLYIQYMEYNHLNFTISDTVYCAIFFVLTGFHGLHVIIGNIFLFCQYLIKFSYRDNRVYGLAFSVIYWHLVDIIWVFLFICVYLFNNLNYLVITDAPIFIDISELYDISPFKN